MIKLVKVQAALTSGEKAQTSYLSRTWTSPHTLLHLFLGQLALIGVTFLSTDGNVACKGMLIGQPLLNHLQVDCGTLLKHNCAAFNGTDCSSFRSKFLDDQGCKAIRIMIARLNCVLADWSVASAQFLPDRPCINYYHTRSETNPFPYLSFLGSVDDEQEDQINMSAQNLITFAEEKALG